MTPSHVSLLRLDDSVLLPSSWFSQFHSLVQRSTYGLLVSVKKDNQVTSHRFILPLLCRCLHSKPIFLILWWLSYKWLPGEYRGYGTLNTNRTILSKPVKDTLPSKISDLILDYYNFKNYFWSFISQWHGLEKETINSYISVILFTLGMNLLGKSAELGWRGPPSKTSIQQPPGRTWLCGWIEQGLEKLQTNKVEFPHVEGRRSPRRVLLWDYWHHHSHTIRTSSQEVGQTLWQQPERYSHHPQNLPWPWSIALQGWQIWVAWWR